MDSTAHWRWPLRLVLLLLAAATGCARLPSSLRTPAPEREWHETLDAARSAADSGRWASADRLLSDYGLRYPERDEAHEALYWRGLFRLSPENDTSAARQAVPTLERYLAAQGGDHRTEARVLLETAKAFAALRDEVARQEREIAQVRVALGQVQGRPADAPSSGSPPGGADRALAQEVERLKGELSRANQELERIRKRLAADKP